MSVNDSRQHPSNPSDSHQGLISQDKVFVFAGAAVVLLTIIFVALFSRVPSLPPSPATDGIFYKHAHVSCYAVLFGVLLAAYLLQPAFAAAASRLRSRWRPLYSALTLSATCLFLCVFIVQVGRHQFGGFDFSILVDTGWRQFLGQHLYTDFVATTPPGFDLAIKYAFQLFGPTWNANLYLSALFACITMVWMYWLMRRLGFSALAGWGTALAIQCQTMLLLSFWWYNNSVLVLAAVFLLSCLAYLQYPESKGVQLSYFIALTLLPLMKPNVAGVALVGGVIMLFIGSSRRLRLLILTLGAAAATVTILVVNHVSITALLSSYHEASKVRGGFHAFGFMLMTPLERLMAVLALFSLSVPGLWILSRILQQLKRRDIHSAALLLFFPLALAVSVYSVMTNGEFWLVDCAPLLAVIAFFSFSQNVPPPLIRRFVTALLCAGIAGSLCMAVARLRVYTIGAEKFFEWTNNENRIDEGFLKDMHVGAPMVAMEQQITAAVLSNPGPYFFGPRIEFNYAVQRVPSPTHLPAWWHPGVAFGMDQEAHLVQVWKGHRFQTLVFLKGDYSFYPEEFMNAIAQDYTLDDHYPLITVYHRRPEQ